MIVATEFTGCSLDDLKDLLAGGSLTIYSVARPISADLPVDRSGVLTTFTFATPAFASPDLNSGEGELETPVFVENPVPAATVGTPGFARARKADGTVVADFSAGPGPREIKFAEVSCSVGAPVRLVTFRFNAEGDWPERPEYYQTRPRTGFPMPKSL